MKNKLKNKCIIKIFENILQKDTYPGMIIASISKHNPDYYYHWIRDSAIVIRIVISHYLEFLDTKSFKQIIDYIENESCLQSLNCISGLGEPKFNVNRTTFDKAWGRPQNDGPALRSSSLLKIYFIFKKEYPLICEIILDIIHKDLIYIIDNIHNPSFDLWEEIYGYHFYTRVVQYKFLKDFLNLINSSDIDDIKHLTKFHKYKRKIVTTIEQLNTLINHHNIKYSSFDINGKPCRNFDASILLGLSHIEYDTDIIDIFDESFIAYVKEMCIYFYNEYPINKELFKNKNIFMLGRYKDDHYYNGNPWFITTLALTQLLVVYKKNNILYKLFNEIINEKTIENIIEYVFSINKFNIDEQLDKNSGRLISAKNLTWNYAELYRLIDMI